MDKKDNYNDNNKSDSADDKQQMHTDNALENGTLSNNQSFEYNESFEDYDDVNDVKGSINVIVDKNRDADTPW